MTSPVITQPVGGLRLHGIGWMRLRNSSERLTCVPKTQAPSPDGRQYGGFIVRVYFGGQLQDARATPPELLTLFPAPDQLPPPPNAVPSPPD
jgi:hypothetical protein